MLMEDGRVVSRVEELKDAMEEELDWIIGLSFFFRAALHRFAAWRRARSSKSA